MMEMKKKDGGAYEPGTLQSFIFQRSLKRYLNDKNYKMNILKDHEFQSPGKFFFQKRNSWVLKKLEVVVPMPRKNYPMLKICCFAPVNLAMKTLSRSNAQFGGYWHFILNSVHEAKAESLNGGDIVLQKEGETGNFNRCLRFGGLREDPRRAVVMVTHEHFILPLR